MAKKDSGNVTITLDRTTVAMLRAKKKDLETWDEMMCRLGRRCQCGIECIACGKLVESADGNMSPNMLAKEYGWESMYSGKTALGGKVVSRVKLGYMCYNCWKSHATQKE
jgi:hypothetical protein